MVVRPAAAGNQDNACNHLSVRAFLLQNMGLCTRTFSVETTCFMVLGEKLPAQSPLQALESSTEGNGPAGRTLCSCIDRVNNQCLVLSILCSLYFKKILQLAISNVKAVGAEHFIYEVYVKELVLECVCCDRRYAQLVVQ